MSHDFLENGLRKFVVFGINRRAILIVAVHPNELLLEQVEQLFRHHLSKAFVLTLIVKAFSLG